MSNTLISIIVPCYNQAQYLDECLQSVLDQTYQNWECIIVNDGSTDNTEEIALQWTAKDPRFTYLKKENGGVSSARNFAINRAIGKWILPLDGDDKIGKQYLELAENQFDKGYSVIYCNAEKFGRVNEFWKLPDFSLSELAYHNIIFCSAFFKKADWVLANGYDTNLIYGLEDWDFWISILKNKGTVYKINKVLFNYRILNSSRTSNVDGSDYEKKQLTFKYIYKKHADFFIDHWELYQDLIIKNLSLKKGLESSNKEYKRNIEKILNSKRYKIGSKIADFIEKLKFKS